MTEPTLQKYFQDDPPSLFDQIHGELTKNNFRFALKVFANVINFIHLILQKRPRR